MVIILLAGPSASGLTIGSTLMNGMAAAFSLFSLFILYCAPTKANPQQGFLPKLDPNKLTQVQSVPTIYSNTQYLG